MNCATQRLIALLLALGCATATAQPQRRLVIPEGVSVPSWNQLDPQQQAALSQFSERWDAMPASRRVLILERYARWEQLPEPRRRALHEGARNFRQVSPVQRQKLRRSMSLVRSLPDEERRRLRQLWRRMTPQQRREWLDRGGPGVAPPP
ncbi:MAG: DUF3106 domain-containing protein [Arenimonas sp.]